ncbi:MAG TPA: hypothetical protein VNZ64_04640 [Candidatus Acidoferrum sp.]|jgi:hypothetical protein|nr:hypothetical protein [Candidatus Acidoferrum sp.]
MIPPLSRAGRAALMGFLFCAGWCLDAGAQINSWTGSVSGNWESPDWSLGVLPGPNQTILFTNAGWKALVIGPNTAQTFPQTLTVDSVTISSPTNSFDTLLLNYSGFQTPLKVNSLTVGSNSAVTMLSSALQLNGPTGSGMSIAGTFNQSDSVVTGNQIDVGYIGPGVYNLNSGLLSVSHLFLEGNFGGIFYQNGGTNSCGIVHLDGGTYVFQDGDFNAIIYFSGGTFIQQGGNLNYDAAVFDGSYHLAGGVHYGNTKVPWTDGSTLGSGSVLQTGGTNFGSLSIGTYGYGSYTLANGVLAVSGIGVDLRGSFNQSGGTTTVTGGVSTASGWINRDNIGYGSVTLNGGTFSTAAMYINGAYHQTGGTNSVAGDVTLVAGAYGYLTLSGGMLSDNNTSIGASWVGGYSQSGGVHTIANQLSIAGNSGLPLWQGFLLSGGHLSVSNIVVTSSAIFTVTGGTINQSGTLSVANAYLSFGSGTWQLGPLQLNSGDNTHSTVYMPSGSGNVQFGDSHSLGWSNQATLIIENWSGSLYGGGAQRILFGNSAAALTGPQLTQIQFHNPANLAAGTYPARILPTGEILPDALFFADHNSQQLVLSWGSGWTLQTATNLAGQFIDLANATSPYTNHFTDPQRFFRLRR